MKSFSTITLLITALLFINCNNSSMKSESGSNVMSTHQDSSLSESKDSHLKPALLKKIEVDSVPIAESFLDTHQTKKVFENKLGFEVAYIPKKHLNTFLIESRGNGLMHTLRTAYDQHRPLVLTPDIIWTTISQGVSLHINQNYDQYEDIIFKSSKPNVISVRNDSLSFESDYWNVLIDSLANKSAAFTQKDYYNNYVPKYSTTSKIQKTAYQITLLHTFKKAFIYVGDTGCGIPYINLKGNQDDWKKMYDQLKMLDDVGLEYWRKELEPIIQQFINVYDDKIDRKFWQSIYKNMLDYNAFYITGWAIKLFPYIEKRGAEGKYDEETAMMKYEKTYRKNPFMEGKKYWRSTLTTDDFPSGVLNIEVIWKNHYESFKETLKIYAGFMGTKQNKDKSLEPLISWCIVRENAKTEEHELKFKFDRNVTENDEIWTPYIVEDVISKPIYNPRKHKTYEESTAYVKSKISSALKQNFKSRDFTNDTITFTVLFNGEIGSVWYSKNDQKVLQNINSTLKGLPNEWFPALADPKNVFQMWNSIGNEKIRKIKVNSQVQIIL